MSIVKDTRMVNDSFSCIKVVTKNVRITLFTAYQTNEITGISDVLETWKRQYIKQLQGIVVSYKNICLMSKYAYIKSDFPVIDCNVRATFDLFIPTVGSIIKGKVNRISHDYIGCLIHDTINAAIDRSSNDSYDVSHFITLDQEILFAITHLGFKRKIIRVKGKITQECINLMLELNLLNDDTDSVRHNILTDTTHDSNEGTTGEENEKSNDTDMETENQSQSLLCNNDDLFAGHLSDRGSNSPKKKKKKSNKLQVEQSSNRLFESLENADESLSLLSYNNTENSTVVSSDSPKKKKKKSNKLEIDQSIKKQFKSSSCEQNEIDIMDNNFLKQEIITDPGNHSPKKKKSKQSNNDSLEKKLILYSTDFQNVHVENDHSTDTSSHFSTSSKKKKHKKSKSDSRNSSSLLNDSISSGKEEIKPFKIPRTPPKKKCKKSQEKFSASEVTTDLKDFASLLHDNDNIPSDLLSTSISSQKINKKSEGFDNMMEVLSSCDPLLKNQLLCNEVLPNNNVKDKSLDSPKKAKKRKHESPDKDSLPKKKRKIKENGSISEKTSKKRKTDKTEKKNKEKSKKDSKRDKKKKSKRKVISSKKKLNKLKKKKKGKGEKLKNKKLKKSSKHKKDVP